MGFQHGYLLAKEIHEPQYTDPKTGKTVNMFKYWSDYVDNLLRSFIPGLGDVLKFIVAPWKEEAVLADRIPDDVFRSLVGVHTGYSQRINELIKAGQAVAKNTIELMDFIRGYIQPDICNILIKNVMTGGSLVGVIVDRIRKDQKFWPKAPLGNLGCTSMGVLSGKTAEQDLLLGCNFDYDPLAGLWEQNLTLIYFNPVKEHDYNKKPQPYVAFTSAGSHSAGLMGVNRSGIIYRVHNNFTSKTDNMFHCKCLKHGQPILNYGDHLLKYGESVENKNNFYDIICQIKDRINCKGKLSDLPASGWALIAGQNKDSRLGKITIFETDFKRVMKSPTFISNRTSTIPLKYSKSGWRKRTRFALLSKLKEIKEGDEEIQVIWQSNFFTNPKLGKKDILIRRTKQLDKLNRFLVAGEALKELYPQGKITWQDIARILSQNKNIFAGNKKRLNVGLIASLVNVSSIIFSVKSDNGNNPKIKIYLTAPGVGNKKITPTANWPYHEINFDDLKTSKNTYLKKITGHPNTNLTTDPDAILYRKAMKEFYQAYTYYTFNEIDEVTGYKILYTKLTKIKKLFLKTNRNILDPYLDFMMGRVQCNLTKLYYKNNDLQKTNAHLKIAVNLFDQCLNNKYLNDPHLITYARLFYVRMGINSPNRTIRDSAEAMYKKLKNETLYFTDLELKDKLELVKALRPYTKRTRKSGEIRLTYFKDKGLIKSINKLDKNNQLRYNLKKLEEDLTFDGPEPLIE
jgi:hypothetical protein